jgi:hypothetical protein
VAALLGGASTMPQDELTWIAGLGAQAKKVGR